MAERDAWCPTHRLLAQHVRLLGRVDDRMLVEFPDGSQRWIEGWPHSAVMIPIETVEREAVHLAEPTRGPYARVRL